jgi:hypothetical protein
MRAALAGILLAALPAAAEPSVRDLQRAAARAAEVHPERVRSWLRRVRLAAIAPSLSVRVGRGASDVRATTALDGSERFTVDAGDTWRLDATATWQLDRLVFDREEMLVSRESQRIAARREVLLTEVAQIYFERRRAQLLLARAPSDPGEAAELELRVAELGAILDGLTDGALTGGIHR